MTTRPLARFAATPVSPEPAGTSVAFLASIDFNGQSVPINTGDVTNGISNLVFSLATPVDIGSIDNFIDYLNKSLGVPLTSTQLEGWINEIPSTPAFLESFKTTLLKILSTDITITVLNVNVAAGTFMLGVSFPINLELTSFLTLNSIGMVVSRKGAGASP
jgi:hypothetical protein